MHRLAVALALLLTAGLLGGPALAANPNREPMHLSRSVYVQNGQVNVPGCLNEDDRDDRWYSGWLAPGETFAAGPTVFCNFITDGTSDGNTGAFFDLSGNTDYAIHWWLVYWACRTVNGVCWGDYYQATRELTPVLVYAKGRSVVWRGCEASVPGTVYFTVTNVGRHGSDTYLDTGNQWHNTQGEFYWGCP